jgi:hypothetical protein
VFIQTLLNHKCQQFCDKFSVCRFVCTGVGAPGKIRTPSGTSLGRRSASCRRTGFQSSERAVSCRHVIANVRVFIKGNADVSYLAKQSERNGMESGEWTYDATDESEILFQSVSGAPCRCLSPRWTEYTEKQFRHIQRK